MQALILAAGIAKRLQPLTEKKPKTLIELGGEPIVCHIFDWCQLCGIKKFNIVMGHGDAFVQEIVKKYQEKNGNDLIFNFIKNPKYREWGNIYSMYVAKDIFNEDFILINSDVIFKKEILKKLLNSAYENALSIDDYKELGDEEMKVYVDKKDVINRIYKKLDPKKSVGEYIGILKISHTIKDKLISALERTLKENPLVYYEDALQVLMTEGVPFYKVSTDGLPCMEIDTHEDLKKARELIKKCD